jgi:hypothetical protein
MFSFQRLDPGHFIIADDPLLLSSQVARPLIQVIDVGVLGFKLIIVLGGQPVTDPMRFEISFFLKDVRRDGPRFVRQYRAG